MQAEELRSLSLDQLETKETELRAGLAKLVMKRNARRLDRSSDLDATKRDLARVLTILAEKRGAAGKTAGERHG